MMMMMMKNLDDNHLSFCCIVGFVSKVLWATMVRTSIDTVSSYRGPERAAVMMGRKDVSKNKQRRDWTII